MDGTLLNSEGKISESNVKALNKIQQLGIEVIIASGRIDLMLKNFIYQLKLRGYVISCNGGLIRNIDTGEIIYSSPMDQNEVKKIITYCLEEQIDFFIYTAEKVYSNKNNKRALRYENLNRTYAENMRIPIEYIEGSFLKNIEGKKILKVLLICKDQIQVGILQTKFSVSKNLTVVSSADCLLDIMASDTTKGNALKILAEQQHVDLKNVIAFGDNYNDLEMLQIVGMPVAMGNSVEEVKASAKFITKSNDDSGIAYALKDIFNL
jgi:Cof subfamily protein (haloacid dehalogenase superfamily)